MESTRFDHLARALTRTFSRRAAVRGGAVGVAAAGLANGASSAARRPAAAQDATPGPVGPGFGGEFLFVQTFAGGTLSPKAGEDGTYALTLSGGADQTVYFSDRPERIVGAVGTGQFLDALGFPPDNPPNAALVAQTGGGEDILVVELLNPVYSQSSGAGDGGATLTYDVRILDDYAGTGLAHLAERQDDADFAETFGVASLFIDDCPDIVNCYAGPVAIGPVPGGPIGTCWSWLPPLCLPCNGRSIERINASCNTAYPDDCNNICTVFVA